MADFETYASQFDLISMEDAQHDAIILFDVLQNFYGAYGYFGGDEVFLPLLDEILDRTDHARLLECLCFLASFGQPIVRGY
jgi:hypothetical protein